MINSHQQWEYTFTVWKFLEKTRYHYQGKGKPSNIFLQLAEPSCHSHKDPATEKLQSTAKAEQTQSSSALYIMMSQEKAWEEERAGSHGDQNASLTDDNSQAYWTPQHIHSANFNFFFTSPMGFRVLVNNIGNIWPAVSWGESYSVWKSAHNIWRRCVFLVLWKFLPEGSAELLMNASQHVSLKV